MKFCKITLSIFCVSCFIFAGCSSSGSDNRSASPDDSGQVEVGENDTETDNDSDFGDGDGDIPINIGEPADAQDIPDPNTFLSRYEEIVSIPSSVGMLEGVVLLIKSCEGSIGFRVVDFGLIETTDGTCLQVSLDVSGVEVVSFDRETNEVVRGQLASGTFVTTTSFAVGSEQEFLYSRAGDIVPSEESFGIFQAGDLDEGEVTFFTSGVITVLSVRAELFSSDYSLDGESISFIR